MVNLRDYQIDLIDRCRQRFAEGNRRVIAQAMTGAGKTHISSEMIRLAVARNKRCLFVAHRRRLIEQKSDRLRMFGVHHGIVMAGEHRTPAMVQDASRDTLLSREELPPADFVVVDECHNASSSEYRALLNRYKHAHILGLTATPTRSDGKGLAPWWQAMECCVGVSRLIEEGALVPIKCFTQPKSKDKASKLIGDPIQHWQTLAMGLPTVLFTSRRTLSVGYVQKFCSAGIPAEHIDSQTPDDRRDEVINRLASGKIMVVCNVGIWTEGVDIPQLACCILLRLAKSYVLYAQAVGRIMRPYPGKTHGVLIDHAGAVRKHGLPDMDVEWSLDADSTIDERVSKQRKKEAKPRTCPRCFLVHRPAPICPNCGYSYKTVSSQESSNYKQGLLVAADGKVIPSGVNDKLRYWKTCLAVMANKGRSCAAASMMYKNRFGEFPRENDVGPLPRKGSWHTPVVQFYPQYAK